MPGSTSGFCPNPRNRASARHNPSRASREVFRDFHRPHAALLAARPGLLPRLSPPAAIGSQNRNYLTVTGKADVLEPERCIP